jgi:uncharacterized membrane protein
MIFKIFRAGQIYRGLKADPTGFGKDEALGLIRGIIIPFMILGAILIILFGIVGYSDWLLIGPFGFFRFLFIVGLILYLIFTAILYTILKSIKKVLDKAKTRVDASMNFDHDVTPPGNNVG